MHSHSFKQGAGRLVGGALVALTGLIGVAAFLYPFFLPALSSGGEAAAPQGNALFLFTLLFALSLVILFAEMESHALNSKLIALLGVLVAINSVLRLADNALAFMNIGGFSPTLLLVILCGYCYGSRFGFLLGALTMVVSALITGGVGPWLPYQMATMGWVGITAGWLPQARLHSRPRLELALLVIVGALWGFAFGAIMNLYFWPFTVGSAMSWTPGMTIVETVQRYALFYVATSAWWDAARAVGNVALLLLFAPAILRILRRFQRRFFWTDGRTVEIGG